jgi:hypothetical protein
LLRKLLLPDNRGRLLRGLIDDRRFLPLPCDSGFLNRRRFAPIPFILRDKQSNGPHQMLGGDVDVPFPENLRDPVNADATVVGLQDLVLAGATQGKTFYRSSSEKKMGY